MKRMHFILTAVVSLAILFTSCGNIRQPEAGTIYCTPAEKDGITQTLEIYLEGNMKADTTILMKAFAEAATVSTNMTGKFSSTPIQSFCELLATVGPNPGSYTLIACNVEEDIAMARIELQLGDMKFTDMFTLVKDKNKWKIVSKVSHRHH